MASSLSSRLDSLAGRIVAGVLALVLGLLAVFLFTAFAALAAIMAIAIGVRAWWRGRGGGGRGNGRTITAEYSVTREDADPDRAREPDAILPPSGRRP